MTKAICVTLTAYNMGDASEADYDQWFHYVSDRIDDATGLDVTVDQARYANSDQAEDVVSGGTSEQRANVRLALADLWVSWCEEDDQMGAIKDIVQVELAGGDADALDGSVTIWVDLDRGNAGSDWAVLTTHEYVDVIAANCGAEVVAVRAWDGAPFGDGSIGCVELRGTSIVHPNSFKPTYVPEGYLTCADSEGT